MNIYGLVILIIYTIVWIMILYEDIKRYIEKQEEIRNRNKWNEIIEHIKKEYEKVPQKKTKLRKGDKIIWNSIKKDYMN